MTVYVDHTHLGRHVTGLERITLELFSADTLAPLDIVPITARGTTNMVITQTFELPLRLMRGSSILLCPGFPPSPTLWPFASRVIPYIHDIFLMTRQDDLNRRAKLYMTEPFRLAVRTYPRFLVNSVDTKRKLSVHCRLDAEILLYRPPVRNVFGLHAQRRRQQKAKAFRFVTLGTIEPRKNFVAAAKIVTTLRAQGFKNATLDIIGRKGWGNDWTTLEACPGVVLHGYQSADRVSELVQNSDAFICTSHEEGLGLPLLEAQYAGLPIIAPDANVFREVLDQSGIFIDPADPVLSAKKIADSLSVPDWDALYTGRAVRNLTRWNALAATDRDSVIQFIARIARQPLSSPSSAALLTRNDPSIRL